MNIIYSQDSFIIFFIKFLALFFVWFDENSYIWENNNLNLQNWQVENFQTIEWTFQSKKWVMDPISCNCFNWWYILNDDFETIPVCFENEKSDIKCDKIEANWYFKFKKLEVNENNVCNWQDIEFFLIKNFACK